MRQLATFVLTLLTAAVLSRATGPPASSGTLTINQNGSPVSVPIYALGQQQPNGDVLTIPYNTRSYLGKPGSSWGQNSYLVMPLLGNTLSYTIDMSNVAVACNAAVYLVTMPSNAPGESKDYYCDANQVGGNWCAEIDLIEANAAAAMVTPHKCDSPQGPCDRTGCGVNSRGAGWWGNGQIDPKRGPFTMSFDFVGSNGQFTEFTCTMTQGGSSTKLTYAQKCGASYLSALAKDVTSGMTLVFSYWGAGKAGEMKWLDGNEGATCPGGGSFKVSNVTLNKIGASADPCQPNPCQNGGTCSQGRCTCTSAWTGDKCTTAVPVDKCASVKCSNGGSCNTNTGKCTCVNNYTGDTCDVAPNKCASVKCSNGGSCNTNTGKCTCVNNYTGDTCDVAPTCSPACSANGKCQNGKCQCNTGYSGATCDTRANDTSNACAAITCENGGKCDAGKCICKPGWQGPTCADSTETPNTQDPCDPNPCQNGGTCLASGKCNCPAKTSGTHCESKNPSAANPCAINNGGCVVPRGTCVNVGGVAQCDCSRGYTLDADNICVVSSNNGIILDCDPVCSGGLICDTALGQCSSPSSVQGEKKSSSSTILIVALVSVGVLLIALGLMFLCCRQQSSAAAQFMKPHPPPPATSGYYAQTS